VLGRGVLRAVRPPDPPNVRCSVSRTIVRVSSMWGQHGNTVRRKSGIERHATTGAPVLRYCTCTLRDTGLRTPVSGRSESSCPHPTSGSLRRRPACSLKAGQRGDKHTTALTLAGCTCPCRRSHARWGHFELCWVPPHSRGRDRQHHDHRYPRSTAVCPLFTLTVHVSASLWTTKPRCRAAVSHKLVPADYKRPHTDIPQR
jgi:hypothetical protein